MQPAAVEKNSYASEYIYVTLLVLGTIHMLCTGKTFDQMKTYDALYLIPER